MDKKNAMKMDKKIVIKRMRTTFDVKII